ncbi:glucose-1-phosphate adenylyltransferase family protein [Chloroflexota bacterium]
MGNVLAAILAGGRGERLSVLAQERSKPAIPFASKYRLIDFTLSNCVNSGIYNVAVLPQYQPLPIAEHIGIGAPWGLATPDREIRLLHPHLAYEGRRGWYKGTADAVYQNLQYIEEQNPELVLVLSGDHAYKMNYSWMLKFHEEKEADVTLAFAHIPEEDLQQFGTITVGETGQVIGFQEKVKNPKSNKVSMGVYLFKEDVLRQVLEEDERSIISKHDFGRNVLPRMAVSGSYKVFAYEFEGYWRDVGTVQSYWQSNMDMIEMSPGGYLSDAGWPIRTSEVERAPASVSDIANVANSLISNGCIIEGHVEHSVLSPGVIVSEGAVVRDSIILSDSTIGSRSIVNYSILDEEVVVEAGCHLGFGDVSQVNRREPRVVNTGITIVGRKTTIPPGVRIGRNCVIGYGVTEEDFLSSDIQSGETLRAGRKKSAREV